MDAETLRNRASGSLFNLKEDPAEMNDLSVRHPDRLKKMIARWEQYKKDNSVLDISLDLSIVN